MAYAAVISLERTVKRLLSSSNPCPESALQLVYEEVCSLQEVLGLLDWNRKKSRCESLNELDAQIRGVVFQFEHVLESSTDELKSTGEQDIDSFIHTSNRLKQAYANELAHEEEGDVHVPSSTIADHFDSRMVGLSDQFTEIKDDLTANYSYKRITMLFGMAGIGKTTLAIKLFQDPLVSTCYQTRAFVTVGQTDQFERVLLDILRQVNPNIIDDDQNLSSEGETVLARMVNQSLQDRKYLIVLDDVWDTQMDQCECFPDSGNGSHVLITSRLQLSSTYYQIRFLDKKESWSLLREKVFGEEQESSCPRELEKAGKKIAEYCEGLPLTIVTVAKHLAEAEKSVEYWNKIAEKKQNNPVFMDAYGQMLEVLYPSYYNLHQHLKPCFLYMGVFPQNYEIPCSKLFHLWTVEEILAIDENHLYYYSNQFFEALVSQSLVLVHKQNYGGGTKTGGLHSPFWYLCMKEAGKIKFFHILNSLDDSLAPAIETHRRLCVHNNVLFGIKDAYNSMDSASSARSLLCTGPYHQYPVPICSCSSLLRVLHALNIHFYEFPMKVLKLVRLRYFSLTCDGKLPNSISKLRNLRFLIFRRHLSIINPDANSSYCPIEIWDMDQLEHLQIMGSDLPDPFEHSVLPNLLTLADVSSHSCTEIVFERVPNLQKLGIRIELSPDAAQVPSCWSDHISHLHKLKTLKCIIANPRIVPVVTPLSIFSSSLEKLTLSGFGYQWKDTSTISVLPNLRVLKLRGYAFRGPEWEVGDEAFPRLQYLLIEDTDLVHWTIADHCSFQMLGCLSIKHCYKLKEIPLQLAQSLRKIELVDCNSLALACANKLKEKREEVFCSLDIINHTHSSLR